MGKKTLEGYEFFFWDYEDQTKIKHMVFKDYIDIWIKKLGKFNNLNYFDCYGGCGAYLDNKNEIYFGSPILAGEVIEQNKETLKRDVNLVIIDQNNENIENIKKILDYKNIKSKPIFIQGDFDNSINNLLDETKNNLNPTFFFIDPFGFKIKYQTLKRIMSIPKSEILLNFMFTQLNRFLIDNLENTLNELFGCNNWKEIRNFNGFERESKILELFRNQLKKFSKFVFPYRLSFPTVNKTYYYLIHLTNNVDGCSIMKSCFAKFNFGDVEYVGKKHGLSSLFDLKDMHLNDLKKEFLERYKNKNRTFTQIIEENIDETQFLESDFRKLLKDMEASNEIEIKRIESKKTGLKGNDTLIFR